MADTHETIADIVAEIRDMADDAGEFWRDQEDAHLLANRIEAAHKRERGDAAKLREALEAIISGYENADLCDMNYGEWCHDPANVCVNVPLCKAIHEARAALSAPPRNCDRFATAEEAIEYHKRTNCAERRHCAYHDGCPTDGSCVVNWLYAEAQEGGAK